MNIARHNLRERVSEELLPFVQQPAQYIGGEWNQLVRPGDWERAEVRVALAFPDAYTIGMSHLGCQILYWQANHTPGVCAERVYCPWVDAERIMRAQGLPLFTWDTRQPAASADIFAVSLQYEMCFTNVLNLLDLAGIPLRARERGTPTLPGEATGDATVEWPLVIAGGPQADNPEPLAEFLDLVVIGDGEEPLAAILAAVKELKAAQVPRREWALRLARRFPFCYAPNHYEAGYHEDGTFAGLVPRASGLPAKIERARTDDFEQAPFPRRPLLPWIDVVHDRIGIEIMRGCPQVCRFCHAGYTKRPLKYRTVAQILDIAEEAYRATGHHEIGLLSLSSADYPHLAELAARFHERFNHRHVNLSFPSLRVDRMLQSIPWMANSVRKGSITMAVEAASDDMRRAIRKKVTDGHLLDGVREVYKAGWRRVKLYFMAGFPGERPADIDAIWELANAVSWERTRLGKPPAEVTASVGWLVPKPFTPLQWMAQPRAAYFQAVRDRLRRMTGQYRGGRALEGGQGGYGGVAQMREDPHTTPPADEAPAEHGFPTPQSEQIPINPADCPAGDSRGASDLESAAHAHVPAFSPRLPHPPGRWNGRKSQVKIVTHMPQRSILEAVFARGDRRLGAVIHEAWRRGARFDGWDETFSFTLWQEAFAATGIDPDWYAHRERGYDERLPWEHIGLHMSRGYLEKSYDDMFAQIGVARPMPLPVLGQLARATTCEA